MFIKLSYSNICFKNIKFPQGNYKPIVPRQKHSIVEISSVNIIEVNCKLIVHIVKFVMAYKQIENRADFCLIVVAM